MTDVKSKNLYELLGNDPDQDSDREPEPPTQAVDKPVARTGKRDAPVTEKPERRGYERRGGGFTNDDRAFRDRTNRRNNPNPNADNPVVVENTDGTVRGRDSGPGTQRGGRGRGGPRRGGDRHVNRSGRAEHQKQSDQAWGQPTGEGERDDEKAGEQIAQQEIKQEGFDANAQNPDFVDDAPAPAEPAPEAEPEPEDTHKSYTEYLAEQARKKLEGLGLKEARAPNEGAKDNKKWKNAKELAKDGDEESYFIGEAKAKRERDRVNKKNVLDIDYGWTEQPRDARGRGRGGRGRGEGRGEGRGRGRGRGDTDGEFRPRGGDRGSYRGGRGRSDAPAVSDDSAFPALGGK